MAASPHRTLVALGAALFALIVLVLGAVPAWAYQDPGSGGGGGGPATAPGTVASSGGTNWALIVGIVLAAVVAAVAIGLIAVRSRRRSQATIAASSADAPAPLLTAASAQPARDEESHDLPKAA